MEVIEEINRGGFGLVEKVRLNNGLIVARKSFQPSVFVSSAAEEEKLRRRFEREVRYMSAIDSDSICPVLESNLESDKPWFTMPFAERTLHEEISEAKQRGDSPVDALADVLNGLEDIHSLGFVHRDLKPMNVLLIDGVWKLADFGLILPPSGVTTMLTSDSAWGTSAYAAPEQAAEFHAVTSAAGIYAFGCILHDIYGNSPRIPFAKHTAPGHIGAIIERCTERNPQKRFLSVGALREALASILVEDNQSNADLSGAVVDWVGALEKNAVNDVEKMARLFRYMDVEADDVEQNFIFKNISAEAISFLHSVDAELWKQLFGKYCDWVADSEFGFAFCDTLIQRLTTIFTLGDTEIKALTLLSAARMAVSHNRWYVMEKLLDLCGPDLDDNVAARLAIDIRAFGDKALFQRCAKGIGRNVSAYHPIIRAAVVDEK